MFRQTATPGVLAAALTVLAAAYPPHAATAAEMKTLKEQLSDKASDEQRVDNCGVPPERRGPVPRPDCDGKATSPGPQAGRDAALPSPATRQ